MGQLDAAAHPASPESHRGKMRRGRLSRHNAQLETPLFKGRRIPAYELLDERALARIEEQADWILETIGVEFRGDQIALDLFAEAGAKIEGNRVRFEPSQARALCETAPATFQLHGRTPDKTVTLGGDNVVLMPGYGSPFVTDLERGRRYATLNDFRNFVKLTSIAPALHHSGGTVVEPTDVPVNKRHLDMMLAHLTLSTKPFMGSVTAPERARDSLDMVRLVFGHDFLDQHAVMQANINVNSPLIYDDTMSRALRVYAEANQCVCVSPAIFAGAMGPLSPAAVAAQTLAEAMVGIALTQLVRPGCPVVFGSFHSTMNLRTGALTFGSPEANITTMALSQLGRRLGVPVRSGGGQITAANAPDGQAMQDSAGAMWATLMSGAHQVWHAAGWLEGGLVMSYEKFILDLDHCGAMLKLLQGFDTDDEAFGRDAYLETGPGENFLSTSHTLRHYTSANFEPQVSDAGPYETWVENGALTADQRASARWRQMLEEYRQPDLNTGILSALEDFVSERKAAMPDEWH
ncbi:trimethylamine methyltransferase family protein [Ruegeria sp. Ofav3-42]|uniref:trimethylamine methyltransferase family protein n=1 Tax=Ruegeria sp. Ofav3-42 TaxID=2917759 RepID=UPI001EF4286B|nr:trimethylamine methyltransferase family protein [Ruegeria sp. Ofav3-42]MCG7522481.1 trimethylamine methyltransferase family protein [Ruegeria sp. Ofav3-42]